VATLAASFDPEELVEFEYAALATSFPEKVGKEIAGRTPGVNGHLQYPLLPSWNIADSHDIYQRSATNVQGLTTTYEFQDGRRIPVRSSPCLA
jgi:hypothetical protein